MVIAEYKTQDFQRGETWGEYRFTQFMLGLHAFVLCDCFFIHINPPVLDGTNPTHIFSASLQCQLDAGSPAAVKSSSSPGVLCFSDWP